MKEINPADVPQMMLDGTLKFGMELEFSDSFKWFQAVGVGKLIAFDMTGDHNNQYFKAELNETLEKYWYRYARFPEPKRPGLRDGDPVVVFDGTDEHHRIFSRFEYEGIVCWLSGLCKWTCNKETSWSDQWRFPTKQELSEADYTADQITEMLTRWGVLEETQKNKTHRAWHESGTTRVG